MPLFWKSEPRHDYPFRNWREAELPVKVQHTLPGGTMTKDGDVKLLLCVTEIKAREGNGYLWIAEATFEGPTAESASVLIFATGGAPEGHPNHLANEAAAKTACVNGAKLALLELINDLR